MRFNEFTIGDTMFKGAVRIMVFVSRLYWLAVLKKIGKGSRIYRGVIIDGNPRRIKIGKNFRIWHRCFLAVGKGSIEIGDNGLLGVNSYINASEGTVRIGNNVAIAPFCQFYSYSHHYAPASDVVDSYVVNDISVGDNVLIGAGSIILPGVTIGEGAIIAAGSVVIKDIEPYTVNGGTPCKLVKKRTK